MPARKMTFTFPEELAQSFVREVGASRRSKFVVEAVRAGLRERNRLLVEACIAANGDPETQVIEREMALLPNTMTDEWDDSDLSSSR